MTKSFMPPTIENDPTYQQFHANATPIGSREAIDWSGCGIEKFVRSRRIPSEIRKKLNRREGKTP